MTQRHQRPVALGTLLHVDDAAQLAAKALALEVDAESVRTVLQSVAD